jgi:hypothetical protein
VSSSQAIDSTAATAATSAALAQENVVHEGVPGGSNKKQPVEAAWGLLTQFGKTILGLPLPLLTFLSLWILAIRPDLRPWEPPPARSVEIRAVEVAEPWLALTEATHADREFGPAKQRFVSLVLADARFVGYAHDSVRAWTVWLDANEDRRLNQTLQEHGHMEIDTSDDQVTYWLDVDLPTPRARWSSSGCFAIHVYLTVDPKEGYGPWSGSEPKPEFATPVTSLSQTRSAIVAHATTPAFSLDRSEKADSCTDEEVDEMAVASDSG